MLNVVVLSVVMLNVFPPQLGVVKNYSCSFNVKFGFINIS